MTFSCLVIIETVEDNRPRAQHFTVDTLNDDTVIKSLLLAINQDKPDASATLVLDCINYGRVAMPKTMREMYIQMENPHLTLVSINILRCILLCVNVTAG